MSKKRTVSTHFWSDNFVIDLKPVQKLLFLYLLTNENTNMLGIYELHTRKMAFDTGISEKEIIECFQAFIDRVSYIDGYVWLHNFTKNQAYNDNMKKSAAALIENLPKSIINSKHFEAFIKPLKPFTKGIEVLKTNSESLRNIEVEYESESEYECESESAHTQQSKFIDEVDARVRDSVIMQSLSTSMLTDQHKDIYLLRLKSNDYLKVIKGNRMRIKIQSIRADAEYLYKMGWLKPTQNNSNEKSQLDYGTIINNASDAVKSLQDD